MSSKEFGVNIHEEWKGMTQPVGLVVEPIVLDRLGIFPEKSIRVISDLQRRLESLLEEQIEENETYTAVTNFKDFCIEVLNWQESDLIKTDEFYSYQSENQIFVELEDYGEILKPDWIVPEINKQENTKKVQILVKELKLGTPFDDIFNDPENKKRWEATHQQRFERLLKDSENPLGIIWNGISLRLVYAPRGESSGHITFPLEPMLSVDGRPMIGALEMLLGPDRLFEAGASNLRLNTLMEQSRKEQNEVGTRLSEQVLEALWILVRGFDEAEDKSKLSGKSILRDLPDKNPNHLYGGFLTILLRLVFLLYVEDEELMPQDSVYVQNYSVSGLAAKLRADRIKYQSGMEGRYGAWSSLLSLFRLVYDGGGPFESYLPARHGELFDPDAYSFLEGRLENSSFKDGKLESLPLVSDDVIERVLNKLLILDGQILSYRSLDVEQIGSVYEGIMGFTIEKTIGPSVGILYKPPRQKIPLTFVINVDELFAQKGNHREKWIKDLAGVDLQFSTKIRKELKEVKSIDELCSALDNRLSPYTKRGLNSGKLILQPTRERRRSGSHYTPRTLTEPVVLETFRPWLELHNYAPTAKEILNFKVCDPAMGSGAFLVASCRLLANYLVKAWEINGFPSEFDETYDKDIYARRLISQRCLYGVDKNPFAVNLAKLSLWLITLSKELPFTFVDHALKCGDSLVGFSIKEILLATKEVQLGLISGDHALTNRLSLQRQENFAFDSRDDSEYDSKKEILDKQIKETDEMRITGNLMVAAFFDGKNPKERCEIQKRYLGILNDSNKNINFKKDLNQILQKLKFGDKGLTPFHWDLEFPEVFDKSRNGFDFFVGNPPFAGKVTIAESYPKGIQDWFKFMHEGSHGNSDIVGHFYRRCFFLLKNQGIMGLIATNTISQGDTRSSSLRWICLNGGTIFSAEKNFRWPGVASVIVSLIHIIKGEYGGRKILNSKSVDKITSFLLSSGGHEDPKQLKNNAKKSFQGSIVLGLGFTFDDTQENDNETAGIPMPLSTMQSLISKNSKNSEVIFPYIGGKEINRTPNHENYRFIVNFGEKGEEECRKYWPEIMNLIEKKVKPERILSKDNAAKTKWWQFVRPKRELYDFAKEEEMIIVICVVQSYWQVAMIKPNYIFSHSTLVIPSGDFALFAILQSKVHETWMRLTSSSLKEDIRYNNTDTFETFPFPDNFWIREDKNSSDNSLENLKKIGEIYLKLRSSLMQDYGEGLSSLALRFNSPSEEDPKILELRNMQKEMDKNVCNFYKWNNLELNYGFGLDRFMIPENIKLPNKLQRVLDSDEIFFSESKDALLFESEIRSYLNKVKFNWRFRWPSNIGEHVLAFLIDLNEESYKKEMQEKSKKVGINLLTRSGKKNQEFSKKENANIQIGLDI